MWIHTLGCISMTYDKAVRTTQLHLHTSRAGNQLWHQSHTYTKVFILQIEALNLHKYPPFTSYACVIIAALTSGPTSQTQGSLFFKGTSVENNSIFNTPLVQHLKMDNNSIADDEDTEECIYALLLTLVGMIDAISNQSARVLTALISCM